MEPSYGEAAPPISASQTELQKLDIERMRHIIALTKRSMDTPSPVPFGAMIVESATGSVLVEGLNAVRSENDPSSHAELRMVRMGTQKLKKPSLSGYTLYTTCEPCPMCMANALWAGLDRVVYGATIADANKHCKQIRIPCREVMERGDLPCVVSGPVLREEAYALFTHPKMLQMFATWNSR